MKNKKIIRLLLSIIIVAAMALFSYFSDDSGSDATVSHPLSEETTAFSSGSSSQENQPEYQFRNKRLLEEHYEKHGKEMGFSSAASYEAAASKVVTNPEALHKKEKEDNDDVYYVKATNEFVIVSTDGFIRTYFYPSNGIKYFNKQ